MNLKTADALWREIAAEMGIIVPADHADQADTVEQSEQSKQSTKQSKQADTASQNIEQPISIHKCINYEQTKQSIYRAYILRLISRHNRTDYRDFDYIDSITNHYMGAKPHLNQPIKILSENLKHHGFQYKEGLNVDTVPFQPYGSCQPGGLYYTTLRYLGVYYRYGTKIAAVKIPADALTYADPDRTKCKADRIILENIIPIQYHPCWQYADLCEELVKFNGMLLEHIKDKSLKCCINALKETYVGFEFVDKQTPELCMFALKKNGSNIKFMKQTLCQCIQSILYYGDISNIRKPTQELCLLATRYGTAFANGFPIKPSFELILSYINRRKSLHFVKQTVELRMYAIRSGINFGEIHNPTLSMRVYNMLQNRPYWYYDADNTLELNKLAEKYWIPISIHRYRFCTKTGAMIDLDPIYST